RAQGVLARARAAAGAPEPAARHFRRAISLAKDAWFELRGAYRESFLALPELRALGEAARALVASAGPAGAGDGAEPIRDPATGPMGHALFIARLDEEIARARRHGRPLALLKIAAEGFHVVTELAGAKAGREVVERLGHAIAGNLREIDLCARYFDDEF